MMRDKTESVKIVVVGGGPAGLMAAIAAARSGAAVTLIEQLDSPGRKLLATGGGRCNLTNRLPPEQFAACFGRGRRHVSAALAALSPAALEEFFRQRGVATECSDGFHVFPRSQRAADVLRALRDECSAAGVRFAVGARVTALCIDNAAIAGVATLQGDIVAQRVIVATGGRSYPSLGATGSGYELAIQAGHAIVEPVPALVGLRTAESWPGNCTGIVLPQCRVWIDQPDRRDRETVTGDVLFTHQGISGPAVLDISGKVARLLHGRAAVALCINPLPERSEQDWRTMFEQCRRDAGKKQVATILGAWLPKAVAGALCAAAGVDPSVRAGEVTRAGREELIRALTGVALTITATAGFNAAMLTDGGVALAKVDWATLQSRLVSGLYFAGEVLDVNGPCGGYNLQWAFASGWVAGRSAGGQ
jgi:predicted Rossmann fold flavoprotein